MPDRYRLLAAGYDALTRPFTSYRDEVVRRLDVADGARVVDVGCGTGLCFAALQERVGDGGAIIGVDPSPAMLELASQRVERHGWTNVTLLRGTAGDVQLPHRVDAALFCAVHDVLRDRDALENVLAHLGAGGRVAAAGGKWVEPPLHPLNVMTLSAHMPFVDSFEGFAQPWTVLGDLLVDLEVCVVACGAGFIATGTVR